MSDSDRVQNYLIQLQNQITKAICTLDPKVHLQEEAWQRPEGGGGLTRALNAGELIEKGGINFSHIHGKALSPAATKRRPKLVGQPYEAMGVSLVLHAQNPHVPIVHLNVRFFSTRESDHTPVWWFGGGFDLSPCYGYQEDCVHWHQSARHACAGFGDGVYPRLKQQCDDYFYLPHRKEARGIGGLFFDDLNEWPFGQCFAFMRSVGDHFLPAYLPIAERRHSMPFSDEQKVFQQIRRGRYVEFNLLYDRGTLFGLQSQGRTESILISMPPNACWAYEWQAKPGSPEAMLVETYLTPRNWVGLQNTVLV